MTERKADEPPRKRTEPDAQSIIDTSVKSLDGQKLVNNSALYRKTAEIYGHERTDIKGRIVQEYEL
jgi:hypothetical protein